VYVDSSGFLPEEVYDTANHMRDNENDTELTLLLPYRDENGSLSFLYQFQYQQGAWGYESRTEYWYSGKGWNNGWEVMNTTLPEFEITIPNILKGSIGDFKFR